MSGALWTTNLHGLSRVPGIGFGVSLAYKGLRAQEAADSEDSEPEDVEPLRPLRNFPAVALITAIHTVLEVRASAAELDPARMPLTCTPSPSQNMYNDGV